MDIQWGNAPGHIDQLSRDAKPLAGAPNTALDHRGHPQSLSDRRDVGFRSLEAERRRARDHAQSVNPREGVDQLVRHTVTEELLIGVGTQVHERQHRD